MNNNRKIYFCVNSSISTDQIMALLDTVQSDNKDEIDKQINDSDMEIIALEDIELTDNPDNASFLTQEANAHVVDEGATHTKELETNKKKKNTEENTRITQKWSVSPDSRENCLFDGEVSYQFDESASASYIYEQVINLYVLTGFVVQQSNLYSQ